MPQIEVTFDIDKNGIVSVKAKDLGTQKEQTITIQSNTSLSEEEIERMVKEAEANAEADAKRKEEADLKNEADQLVFMTEKTLKDLEDKVSEEEKQEAETAKDTLKAALEANDSEDIKAKRDALQEIVQKLTMKLYEQAAAEQQAAEGNPTDDGVVDADFEEVDDKKDK